MPSLKKNRDGTPHIHQYVRMVKLDGTSDKNRFRCLHPDCTHWAYRNFLKGKRSLCTGCGTMEIFLDYENLRRAKPVCFKCGQSTKAKAERAKFHQLNELSKEHTEHLQPPAAVRELSATEVRKARLQAERENPALRDRRKAIEGIMKTFNFTLEDATAMIDKPMIEKAMIEKQLAPETKQ